MAMFCHPTPKRDINRSMRFPFSFWGLISAVNEDSSNPNKSKSHGGTHLDAKVNNLTVSPEDD
jgi:hypothetical protein